ncbi:MULTISPECIES: hypothetical protein [unclassified Chitinophaga]|nr:MULTISPECIES: hypothetical protein [unclassified Chitinophaga]WPV66082.1 hypothetical protein QQL36_30235 [Chitinophaga sp. LS1]
MKSEQTSSKPIWTTPDIKVYEVNDLTLGNGGGGFDFGSEVSA